MKKIVFFICVSLLFSIQLSAQGWLDKVGKKALDTAKQKVENRVTKKAGDSTDKTLDKIEKKDSKTTHETNENSSDAESAKEEKLTTTSKYDFIPGEKVIFFDDFSASLQPFQWEKNIGVLNIRNVAEFHLFQLVYRERNILLPNAANDFFCKIFYALFGLFNFLCVRVCIVNGNFMTFADDFFY